MADFPTLKTGAVAQYPSDRSPSFSTQLYRFVDGTEQRFASFSAPLRRWTIRLELLDERELSSLRTFFEDQGGRAGSFAFTDPWDGAVYPDCSFDQDTLELGYAGPQAGKASVVVKENR